MFDYQAESGLESVIEEEYSESEGDNCSDDNMSSSSPRRKLSYSPGERVSHQQHEYIYPYKSIYQLLTLHLVLQHHAR